MPKLVYRGMLNPKRDAYLVTKEDVGIATNADRCYG
jgi:hypothetical protein